MTTALPVNSISHSSVNVCDMSCDFFAFLKRICFVTVLLSGMPVFFKHRTHALTAEFFCSKGNSICYSERNLFYFERHLPYWHWCFKKVAYLQHVAQRRTTSTQVIPRVFGLRPQTNKEGIGFYFKCYFQLLSVNFYVNL